MHRDTPAARYVRFSDLTGRQRNALREIYEDAFPEWQRVPFDQLVQLDADPDRIQEAMVEGRAVLGLFVVSRLKSVPWWFVEYFAVLRERRDAGLGGRIWEELIDRIGGAAAAVVLEVEPPEDEQPGSGERLLRERRVAFYVRRGAARIELPAYWVPHLTGEGTDRLALLAVPAEGRAIPAGDELKALVRSLYLDGYGLPANHHLLDQALTTIQAR